MAASSLLLAESTPGLTSSPLWLIIGGASVLLCAIFIGGIVLARNLRSRQPEAADQSTTPRVPKFVNGHSQPVALNGNGDSHPKNGEPAVMTQRKPIFSTQKQPVAAPVPRLARADANGHRRRDFDYNRYFADLMSSVSSHTFPGEQNGLNGHSHNAGPVAGMMASHEMLLQAADALPDANAQLIANQKNLIEDQRRLIQEQTRLIEEKTRLIAEKNQLLKLQNEIMEQRSCAAA